MKFGSGLGLALELGLGLRLGLGSGLGLGLGLVEGPRNMPMRTVEVAGSIRPNLSSDELTVPLYVKAVRMVGQG